MEGKLNGTKPRIKGEKKGGIGEGIERRDRKKEKGENERSRK